MFGKSNLHPSTCVTGIMARAALYVLVLSFLLALRSGNAIAGGIDVAPETQYTPQGNEATFTCDGYGTAVQWVLNNQPITYHNQEGYEDRGFRFESSREPLDEFSDIFNLTLWILGTVANNNTKVQCLTTVDTSQPSAPAYIIVLGRPSPVDPQLRYLNDTFLSVDWNHPFTWEGYEITEYDIHVMNETTNEYMQHVKLTPGDGTSGESLQLQAPMGQIASSCHELVVSITAKSDLGMSDAATISVWFPVAPSAFESLPDVEVRFSSSENTLKATVIVSFILPDLCPSQLIDYSIVVREPLDQVIIDRVDQEDYRVSEGSEVKGTFESLTMDKDYEATVSISGVTGGLSAVSKFRTSLTEVPSAASSSSDSEDDQEVYIIVGVSVGGAVIITLFVLIAITGLVIYKRRQNGSRGNGRGKKSMTNPIYEGPLYETIQDATLSSSSSPTDTPTVVRESPYFGNQIHPTYENGNTARLQDMSFQLPVSSSSDDSYTVMSSATPAAKKLDEKGRPKPDAMRYVKTEC